MPRRASTPVAANGKVRQAKGFNVLVCLTAAVIAVGVLAGLLVDGPVAPPARDDSKLVLSVIPLIDSDLRTMNSVNDAVEICMADAGYPAFDYPELTSATYLRSIGTERPIRSSQAFTVSNDTLDRYRQVAASALTETPTMAVDAYPIGDLTPDEAVLFWEMLSGPSGNNGGCIGAGIAAIYGSVNRYDLHRTVVGLLPRGIDDAALEFGGTAKALDLWRDCMSEGRFVYATPVEALSDVLIESDAWERIVSADTECKRASRLSEYYASGWVQTALDHGISYADLDSAAAVTIEVSS